MSSFPESHSFLRDNVREQRNAHGITRQRKEIACGTVRLVASEQIAAQIGV
ncbi:hypothetical protein KSB_84260 [Ktedonobacter robiniae]|uniref:Transcriptional regulator n=1 Tax=Ktedonobacter robiniae TaxID=2778365 RepID=A0ABQ3V452_9CHLR|nr:hypothetical protein KSB_84260 [Ktedonobacter robiniae]